MSERKPTVAFFISIVVVTALVFYPLAFGPACWLVENGIARPDHVGIAYEPCLWLDFQAPSSVQRTIAWYAEVWYAGKGLAALRNRVTWRSYPVGDLAYRLEDDQRVFNAEPWLIDTIWGTCTPDSWEELSGPGKIRANPARQTFEVLQSRSVHAEVAEFLQDLRTAKRRVAGGREIDSRALNRALSREFTDKDFRPDILAICSPREEQLVVGEQSFAGIDELLEFLGRQPADALRSGIFWSESSREPSRAIRRRLEDFCRSNDVDLFIRPNYSNINIFGQLMPKPWWIVRTLDSVYLDPD